MLYAACVPDLQEELMTAVTLVDKPSVGRHLIKLLLPDLICPKLDTQICSW